MKKKKDKINKSEETDNFLLEGTIGNLDLILPDAVLDYDDYIKLSSDKFVRVFAVLVHMHESYVGCFDFLYEELGENIDSTDHIEPVSSAKAINELTREITIVKSNENLKSGSNMDNDEGALQVIADLDNLKKQIQLGTEKLFFVRKIFRIWGKSKQDLEDNCKIFKEKCEGRSLIIKELILNQDEGFKTSLPIPYVGTVPGKFKKNFSAASLAGILPEGMTDFGHKKGIPLGSLAKKNSHFVYNFFEGPPTLPNPMAVLIGSSGSGKSTLMKLIRSRSSILGAWNIGLDLEGEFEKITTRTGGHYINIRSGEKTGINPLDLEIEEDEKGRKFIDIQGKVAEMRELLNIFSTKFNNKSLDGMEIAIKDNVYYHQNEINALINLCKGNFDFIIIDAGNTMNLQLRMTYSALINSDNKILITDQLPKSYEMYIKGKNQILDDLKINDFKFLILNKYLKNNILPKKEDVADKYELTIISTLPYVEFYYQAAADKNISIFETEKNYKEGISKIVEYIEKKRGITIAEKKKSILGFIKK